MSERFLILFLTWLLLCLVQTVAALPWLATFDQRTLHALRRPKVLAITVASLVVVALIAAFRIGDQPDVLTIWGRIYFSVLHIQLAVDFFIAVFAVLLRVWPKGSAVAL